MTKITADALVSTGIPGLDEILGGGLPRDRTYLVKGPPGVGKTTLALQFLLSGVEKGERCLYITLSETRDELNGVAESHGWSLDGVKLFELTQAEAEAGAGEYTMYHPSEIELGHAMKSLLVEVEQFRPQRVVFDSLSEVRLLAQQPLRYRRQILALKQYFAGTNCTVLLLDDQSAEVDNHLESLAHGVIALERRVPHYGGARRQLEVMKLRGVQFRDGFHDFTIQRGGLQVYPRLVAADHLAGTQQEVVTSGVSELDGLLGGGLNRGTATLVLGPSGSGKSALAAHFLCAVTGRGERGVVYTFDEGSHTLFTRAHGLGLPLAERVKSGHARVQQIDPAEMGPGQFAHLVRTAVEQEGMRFIIIDSLTGYLNAMTEEHFLLNQLHELLTFLGRAGVVTILVATQHGLIGSNMLTPVDVSYLADAVILLRYFEAGGCVHNAISVVKKRTGAHERTIREFALTSSGVRVGAPLRDFHGVLTGVPTYTGKTDPLMQEGTMRGSDE
ncbi:MAG TPA: ATPase domain-containing protein [Polyangiaceae bacterium]|nr:ATPase domain-containing protein [Polyangiaceae bacterium]